MRIYESLSEEQTYQIGYEIGNKAKVGDVYCLIGDLGVGKTVFSKGFASGLQITEPITSPTFTIVQEYEGSMPLYHFDMYRIEDIDELEMIGYEDYFLGQGVCLVEWANNVEEVIPKEAKWITIEKDLEKGFDYRKITIK
ncbi:tRNA (adenosine(37)-N6)-threonylcarbamoyltransferase complex ATPase subunit type 1 TsaE [Sporanaerobium hydrogeniformans]|uniref:tRNA (Adenosine(37)-N6)-threonylcarbamoyltransferase complex ATPase subunit type 1 TsaE n=1 Tax=Sporanaerobium hydrogeniformans TaxID=3072179 RepID=A0AC61DGM9_9FIRM|nr:tRNA (adenosine(37)-N6)-threonylcarbamoyltransferase complex ATPase subunit type 1 TsaE [Sporanaerobium hydrogeniformans]PHV72023.1 tRNA (adenosine(37)-N6)-threonylcarbamoyltransferase complex ATPase subunit type 1 TsaE [Sporanaerobium hydrogeniformans]